MSESMWDENPEGMAAALRAVYHPEAEQEAEPETEPAPDLDAALEEAEAEVERLVFEYDRLNPRGGKETATFRQAKKRLTEGRDRVRSIQTRQRENVFAAASTMLIDARKAKWAQEASKEIDKEIADLNKKAQYTQGNTEAKLRLWDMAAMAERRRAETIAARAAEKLAVHTADAAKRRTYQDARNQGLSQLTADAVASASHPKAEPQTVAELAEEYRAANTTLSPAEWVKKRNA